MTWAIPPGPLLLLAGVAAGQAAALATLFTWRRRRSAPSAPLPTAVLLACRGAEPGLEEAARALLAQAYGGALEFLFVVSDRSDAAVPVLERVAAASSGRARVVATGRSPTTSGGKACDLAAALRSLGPGPRWLVFADADLRVPAGWLEAMTEPLEDDAVSAVTAPMVYWPGGFGLGTLLRSGWMAAGTPFLAWAGVVTGQSMAFRRSDLEAWDAAGLWERALFEDLALTGALAASGRRVAFVAGAMPASREPVALPALFAMTSRWMLGFKHHVPWVWWSGAALTGGRAALWAWAFSPLGSARGVAAVWAVDALALAGFFAAYAALAGERPRAADGARALLVATLAPLVHAVYLADYAASAFARRVLWGGRVYRVSGPFDVTVEAGR